jgi:hypothetical protein
MSRQGVKSGEDQIIAMDGGSKEANIDEQGVQEHGYAIDLLDLPSLSQYQMPLMLRGKGRSIHIHIRDESIRSRWFPAKKLLCPIRRSPHSRAHGLCEQIVP